MNECPLDIGVLINTVSRNGLIRLVAIVQISILAACSSLPGDTNGSPLTLNRSTTGQSQQNVANTDSKPDPSTNSRTFTDSTPPADTSPDYSHMVYFETGSSSLPPQAQVLLNDFAARLKNNRRLLVTLIGRTEKVSSKEFCVAIATRLTDIVEDNLVNNGVNPAQIRKYPRGCDSLIHIQCPTGTCPKLLRTVELKLVESS